MVEERGLKLLAPLSDMLLSGTSRVLLGAGDERVVGLAFPGTGMSYNHEYNMAQLKCYNYK